jgi:predicted permease
MGGWRRFFAKLRNFLQPGRAERELTREVEAHLQLLQDDYTRRGMGVDEARRAAKRTYGGIEQAKELHRDERSWVWLEHFRQDVQFAIRTLSKSPAFSLTAIATLTLGIGANTAIFSLIDSVMLKTLPVSHPEQLMQVTMASRNIWGVNEPFVSNPIWEQFRGRQEIFSGLFAYALARFNLSARGEARYVQGNYVSSRFFDTLGLLPVLGRTFTPADDQRGCAATAVLSYGFWQSEYGGRSDIIGKTILLDNHPFEIVGAIGPGFSGVDVGRKSDIYAALCAEPIIGGESQKGLLDSSAEGWLRVIGRPKPGLSINQVSAQLKALAGPIMRATLPPNIRPDQEEIYLKGTFGLQKAANGLSSIRSKYRQTFIVLMVIVGVVLLIACGNVANLLLVRGASRQREIAIRMALGSVRGRLMRQLLTESMLLALTGALLGIVFARWGAQLLVSFLSSNVYRESKVFLDVTIDCRVLTFAVGVAIATGLLFGLAPAWRATRVDPRSAMKANSRRLTHGGRLHPGKVLVVFQVALSLVLVAGAGLLLATFVRLATLDPGFERDHVLLMNVGLSERTISPEQRSAIFTDLLHRLRAIRGVRSASSSETTPLEGAVSAFYLQIDDNSPARKRQLVCLNEVSNNYFETLGTPILAGRDFDAHDILNSSKVVIVNESFAQSYFHGQNPIGRRYRAEHGDKIGDPVEIVGLVHNTKYLDLREDFRPTAYVAASQNTRARNTVTFELRAAASATALIRQAKSAVDTVYPDASLRFKTLAAQVDQSLSRERLLATLSGFFGALALLLATIGLYGVTSYSVARRRNEIGIRMALGAGQSRVLRMVLSELVILISIGLAAGFAASLGVTRFIASLLYGVKANDPTTLSLAAALLALVAATAGFVPARRASRLDPMDSLREE